MTEGVGSTVDAVLSITKSLTNIEEVLSETQNRAFA